MITLTLPLRELISEAASCGSVDEGIVKTFGSFVYTRGNAVKFKEICVPGTKVEHAWHETLQVRSKYIEMILDTAYCTSAV